MFSKKIIFRILINTFIGVVLVTLWLQFVDIAEILSTLSKVDPIKTLPIMFFVSFTQAFRALRLKILLAKIINIPAKDLIFLNGVALLLNFLIPIRAGEIAKGIYLNQSYDLPLGKSLAWIFIDRFIDFVFIILAAGVLLLFVPTALSPNFASGLILLGLLLILMIYLMVYHHSFAKKLFEYLEQVLIIELLKKYFRKIYLFLLDTTAILKVSAIEATQIILITGLAYFFDSLAWYFAFYALGEFVPLLQMYLGQLLSALTYLIPAAPGYIGSAEASGLLILSGVLGYGRNLSSAMIVLFHVCVLISILLYGIVSIYGLKLDIMALLRKALKRE